MTAERRRFPRVTVLPADLRVLEAHAFDLVATVDFSIGGLRIEVTRAAKVSDLLDITLQMGELKQVFNATVRRVVQVSKPEEPPRFQLGIEFDDPELVGRFIGDVDDTI